MLAAWDPDTDSSKAAPSKDALARITRDLQDALANPLPGITVIPSADIRSCQAVVLGPADTPYDSAPFLFTVLFPCDYPFAPPKVKLLTTGGGVVRFGPNLYANGKVCLSILGTWSGPSWLPCHTLSTVLLSIQSLMHAEAARNEPGHEAAPLTEVRALNSVLAHEALRVACLEQMRAARLGGVFSEDARDCLVSHFLCAGDALAARARALAPACDGSPFAEPPYARVVERGFLGGGGGTFRFAELAGLLEAELLALLGEEGAEGAEGATAPAPASAAGGGGAGSAGSAGAGP